MPPTRRPARLIATLTAAVLAPLATVSLSGAAQPAPQQAAQQVLQPAALQERGKAGLRAEITWTKHGIPHIEARDVTSLGLGSGYAATEMTACTLFDTLVTGRGERSRW